MRILLGLGGTQLRAPSLGNHLAQDVIQPLLREQNAEMRRQLV